MSLEDLQTHHIDVKDLIVAFLLVASFPSFLFLILGLCFQKYCGVGDVILFSILCTHTNVSTFIFITGLLGIFFHGITRKKIIPFVPVMTVAYYLSTKQIQSLFF